MRLGHFLIGCAIVITAMLSHLWGYADGAAKTLQVCLTEMSR